MLAEKDDPLDPDVLRDPYPWLKWLRAEAPVHYVEKRGYWVLSRYADVFAMLRDHTRYSSTKGPAPEPGFAASLVGKDPPNHTRLRHIVQGAFTPRGLEERWGAR